MGKFIEPNPRRTEIPENVIVIQLVKKFDLKVTSRFVSLHKSLTWDPTPNEINPVYAITSCLFVDFFFYIFSYVCLNFPNRIFLSGFPTKILYPHSFFLTSPPHPPWFHQINIPTFGDKYKIRLLSLWHFLRHYGSSILLSTQFSITFHALLLRTHHPSHLFAEAFQYFHSLNVFDFVWRSETLLQFMAHYLLRNTNISPSVSYNSRSSSRKKNIYLPSTFFSAFHSQLLLCFLIYIF
jgi:hypothetical protein